MGLGQEFERLGSFEGMIFWDWVRILRVGRVLSFDLGLKVLGVSMLWGAPSTIMDCCQSMGSRESLGRYADLQRTLGEP